VRPGVKASEVDDAVNNYLRRQGLPTTPYAMGHGVGLRACELPTIYRSSIIDRDQVIVEGSVIALEPETGLEINGEFVLLKLEDNYVVQSDGVRRLSPAGYGLNWS
jgi:Xaa-Pro aminopeptidase